MSIMFVDQFYEVFVDWSVCVCVCMQAAAVSAPQGVLPHALAPDPAHGNLHAEAEPLLQCHYRTAQAGCRPGRGHH